MMKTKGQGGEGTQPVHPEGISQFITTYLSICTQGEPASWGWPGSPALLLQLVTVQRCVDWVNSTAGGSSCTDLSDTSNLRVLLAFTEFPNYPGICWTCRAGWPLTPWVSSAGIFLSIFLIFPFGFEVLFLCFLSQNLQRLLPLFLFPCWMLSWDLSKKQLGMKKDLASSRLHLSHVRCFR